MSAMKVGTEDRNKLILAGALGVLMVGYLIYTFVGSGGSDTPAPAAPAAVVSTSLATPTTATAATPVAHVQPSKLDPALHPEAMLLTESLVYEGRGRNIFLPGSPMMENAAANIPKPAATPRYVPSTPVNTGPPPPPPIDLRFFGTTTSRDGKRRVFLLHGEDVFVASTGDIVSRRYRVGEITANNVEVTDLTNNNTQRLPLITQ
jgi:hypothetical protein